MFTPLSHPRKKARLTVLPPSGPDGFEKTSAAQQKAKITVPQFKSGFTTASASGSGNTSHNNPFVIPTAHTYAGPLKKLAPPQLTSILPNNASNADSKHPRSIRSPPKLPTKTKSDGQKQFLTLSTTSIARATDINTDSGNAELASIFISDQHPDILQGTEDNSDTRRGLNFSPQKKRHGHPSGPQFIRNALAARASHILGRTRTSLILWQKEMENRVLPVKSGSSSNSTDVSHLKPDLHMTIIKILRLPVPFSAKSTNPSFSPGIALCQIHSSPIQHTTTTTTTATTNTTTTSFSAKNRHHHRKLHKVVFSFSLSPPGSPHSPIRNAAYFSVGAKAFVWKPWHELDIPSPSSSHRDQQTVYNAVTASGGGDGDGDGNGNGDGDGDDMETTLPESTQWQDHITEERNPTGAGLLPPLLASFPMPLTPNSTLPENEKGVVPGDDDDALVEDTVLFCHRFLFVLP
ncbi:hypothetical protein AX17_003822 [Amanita inopinata Kibby_2008]|nr:hypothetical protein AX17_003822 [Amanita inopinata Kibby_2008]